MTIQEKAIEQLERISEHLSAIGEKEDYTDVAIKALEQEDILEKVRTEIEAEINESISMWVGHKFIGHTDQCIENILHNALSQAKERILNIIDNHRKGGAE